MDEIDKLMAALGKLKDEDGLVVKESRELGTAGERMEMPLKDRIAPNTEGAMTRARLQAAQRGESWNESGLTPEEIEAADDAVAEQYADDLLKKLFGD